MFPMSLFCSLCSKGKFWLFKYLNIEIFRRGPQWTAANFWVESHQWDGFCILCSQIQLPKQTFTNHLIIKGPLLDRNCAPSWTKKSTKKIYRWQLSTWKDASHHMSSAKCNLKQHWDTTMHILEWPKSRTLTTANAGEDVEQQEISFIAGGNAKRYNHFRGQFNASYKSKHTLTI